MKLSPSTRRAWIEILNNAPIANINEAVALHPEGVDRNSHRTSRTTATIVALHPEGVDRNDFSYILDYLLKRVALHPEGVDRNII